ncbi:hypothetical protein [Prosthecobacter sp.]|uniref:serine/threonine protein kinase n=1 Tax=Prosthecobacter sp. TaxID=1965333 RepID=UPI001DB55287|nr:hypothetical protein [Prosthecobacter sp.]MCB1275683.1 hypothetical protein [Prosthecobacter sp.]
MYADHFQPEKIIAAGPSAKVYRGVEVATGRKVLIKALLDDHETACPLDRERLQLLAPSLMQVRHPQIAGLITLLPTEDEFALVSEFMPGVNARAFAAGRTPSPADLRALAVQFMHALLVGEHLRQPHGDPKPSNLIIADHPGGGLFLQVQDWGISLARREHPPETLWFRAPELHAGSPPTTQSDLFTAAASLFCIATNTAPAQGDTVEQVMSDWQAFNCTQMLNHMRPDLDPPLRDWLGWLLNLTPQQRPQSVGLALDMLMRSMHTGFIHMPQQPPVMAPGAHTTPLAAPTPNPNAPRPKPVTPRPPSTIETKSDSKPEAPPPRPPRNKKRVFAAVVLNLAALGLIAFFGWGWLQENGAGVWKDISSWAGSFKVEAVSAPAAVEPAPAAEPAPQPSTTVAATKAPSQKKSKPKPKPKAAQTKPTTTTAAKPAESKK